MISEEHAKIYCCEPIENIENYEEAVASPKKWECHHRRGITPEGKSLSHEELDAMGLYKKRPASELIFLTVHDHRSLHHSGERSPMYGRTGEKNPMYGRTGEKNPMYGKHHTEDVKEKKRQANLGLKFFNNGTKCVRARECPEGYVPGRLPNKNRVAAQKK